MNSLGKLKVSLLEPLVSYWIYSFRGPYRIYTIFGHGITWTSPGFKLVEILTCFWRVNAAEGSVSK